MAQENDVVLIYYEDKPLTFARIEKIDADIKKNWYHIKLLLLQLPLQTVTWILKDAYINGEEFTMDGKKMRLELIVCPNTASDSQPPRQQSQKNAKPEKNDNTCAKVITLTDIKK